MMLKRKSTQWARLKLLLFAPLAVVLLQAFARPESLRTQESLIDSEDTVIFQQSQQWTKNYFDGKVDEYLQKVEGKSSESKKWPMVDVSFVDENWVLLLGIFNSIPPKANSKIPPPPTLYRKALPKTDEGKKEMLDRINTYLKDREKEKSKKNLHTPSIIYLHIENIPDFEVQPLFNALGELNEEFTKAREEQKLKNKNAKFTEKYSDVPVFVVINERIKDFDFINLATNNKNDQSSVQQKPKSILQDEFDKPKESYRKSNSVIIENVSDSTKKLILNGTMIMTAGEKKFTISGDSVEINLNSTQSYSFSSKEVENIKKHMENQKIQIDSIITGYNAIKKPYHQFDTVTINRFLNNNDSILIDLTKNPLIYNNDDIDKLNKFMNEISKVFEHLDKNLFSSILMTL